MVSLENLAYPAFLSMVSSGVLVLFARLHPEPEKMLTDTRSRLIARVTNSGVVSNMP
ncbi:MAG: hypothetical protein ACUVTP_02995 [Candidatus Fervidibacter sp.]|uniref:hypothetical protein n=1 Tax=Candidatus Fervidibacter sp. TaxID=3100871 RepID=UPI00404B50AC